MILQHLDYVQFLSTFPWQIRYNLQSPLEGSEEIIPSETERIITTHSSIPFTVSKVDFTPNI